MFVCVWVLGSFCRVSLGVTSRGLGSDECEGPGGEADEEQDEDGREDEQPRDNIDRVADLHYSTWVLCGCLDRRQRL